MSKPDKSADRRAVVEQMRKKQRNADRRRNFAIVGVCIVFAVAILAAALVPIFKDKWDQRAFDDQAVDEIGAPATSCQDIETKKADGNQNHVPVGQQVEYTTAPPAFGPHWNEAGVAPAPFSRKIYTEDRPELEALVHNLEHGYTILWYDETIADDDEQMDQIEAIADKFSSGSDNMRDKFIAAPWWSDDGDAFPEGQHIAFTHWSVGGEGETNAAKQQGIFQYCSEVSGEALDTFMEKYPYFDSPEPGAM